MYDASDDYCCYYKKLCDSVSDYELDCCTDGGRCCHDCPLRIRGGALI